MHCARWWHIKVQWRYFLPKEIKSMSEDVSALAVSDARSENVWLERES